MGAEEGQWPGGLVALMKVKVGDGQVPTGITQELGESERLVGLRHRAEEPAWEGSQLKAGGEPRVPEVEGEGPGHLRALVELHDIHQLRAEGQGEGHGWARVRTRGCKGLESKAR